MNQKDMILNYILMVIKNGKTGLLNATRTIIIGTVIILVPGKFVMLSMIGNMR